MFIPVVVQHRHIHLSEIDFQTLFGSETLQPVSQVSHFGQFVSDASLEVHGTSGFLSNVRVLGPFRENTQVELSISEAQVIGLRAPMRLSGDLTRTASCLLKGPVGTLRARSSVIVPMRHLHLNESTAKQLGLSHGQILSVVSQQEIPTQLDHVTVRVHPSFSNEFHLTSDEAAQHWLQTGHTVSVCAS